jgi:hypothetical protein
VIGNGLYIATYILLGCKSLKINLAKSVLILFGARKLKYRNT